MPKIPDMIETWQMVRPWSEDRETGALVEGKFERVSLFGAGTWGHGL